MTGRRVLVTDAESTKSLAVVRALGPTMEVWSASPFRFGLAAWSRYVKRHLVYDFDSPCDFSRWVLTTCKKYGIQIVITPEEQTSFLLSRDRRLFSAEEIVLTTPDLDVLQTVMDKAKTLEAARQLGVPVPPTRVLQNVCDAIPAARELGYPVVIKPRYSHFWNGERFVSTDGVRYANSDEELISAFRQFPKEISPPLLQGFIPGRGVGVFLALGKDGALCAEFSHERLRDLRPTGSGSVLRRSIAMDPNLRETSLSLLRHIGWWGVAMVEFRIHESSKVPYLMEINGRFWGSLQLAIDAGVNFPRILIDVTLGKSVDPPKYRAGVLVRWWLGDLVRTLHILRGKPRGFTGSFPARMAGIKEFLGRQAPGTLNQVFRPDDPWPALGEILSLAWR